MYNPRSTIKARMLTYITGTVDQELLLKNEYLAAENRILRAQITGRLLLSDGEKDRPAVLRKIPSSSHLTDMLALVCSAFRGLGNPRSQPAEFEPSPAPPVISLIFYDVRILNSLGLSPALHIPSFSLNESIALT
jgi:hypothetical protein